MIGKLGRRIPRETALEHVVNYSQFNGGSIPDLQLRTSQWTVDKKYDGTGTFGRYLATADELPEGCMGLWLVTRLSRPPQHVLGQRRSVRCGRRRWLRRASPHSPLDALRIELHRANRGVGVQGTPVRKNSPYILPLHGPALSELFDRRDRVTVDTWRTSLEIIAGSALSSTKSPRSSRQAACSSDGETASN